MMECCSFARWRGPSMSAGARSHRGRGIGRPAASSSSFSAYLNHPPTPHLRHEHYDHWDSDSSTDQVHLIPKHRHTRHCGRRFKNMPASAYGETIQEDWSKTYRIAIPNRELKWDHLQRYLLLEFEGHGLKLPKEQTKSLNDKYVVILPAKLTAKQLQDIDLLRGNDEDAETFLEELKVEREAKGEAARC